MKLYREKQNSRAVFTGSRWLNINYEKWIMWREKEM
jgi:hypothetical protein